MSSLRHREGDLQELPGERPLPTAHAKSCSHKAQQHWTMMKLKLISPPSSTFFCCSHFDPTTAHRKHPHSPAAQEDWARTTAAGQTSSPLICTLSNNAFPRGVEGCYRGPAGRGPPAEQQTAAMPAAAVVSRWRQKHEPSPDATSELTHPEEWTAHPHLITHINNAPTTVNHN